MPMRQIRKQSKQSKSHRKSKSRRQRGGDPGRIALAPAFWGQGTRGYYADGSKELNSCARQNAVSQGVISKDGFWAGPNLYPMLGGKRHSRKNLSKKNHSHKRSQKGGSCGCSGRRQYKPKSMKA